MVSESLLKEMGVLEEDIAFIFEQDAIYGDRIAPLAKEYSKLLGHNPFVPYENTEVKKEFMQKTDDYVNSVIAFNEESPFTMRMLAWLYLLPDQEKRYEKYGIDRSVFVDTAKNLRYKINESKSWRGVCGISTNYFRYDFDLKLFELGRLQYEAITHYGEAYVYGDIVINPGDTVYFCHIPSSGKLTPELCMESLHKGYEFFKDKLNGSIFPVFCQTWLLHQPYVDKIFPEGSNMKKFAEMFDIYKNVPTDFTGSMYVFGKKYEGSTEGFPEDTTLRRNFIEYINAGGEFGEGRGMILYDGEKREIINRR